VVVSSLINYQTILPHPKGAQMKHPDIHHIGHFEGGKIGVYDSKVHGKGSEESHGMKNVKGEKACPLDEKHYAHIK
jgi:hypothetical protein